MEQDFETVWAAHRDDVDRIARSVARGQADADELADLVAAGQAALWQALGRYTPMRGPFWPYAQSRVRGAMLDHLRQIDYVGRCGREKLKRDENAQVDLAHRASLDDLAYALPSNDNPEQDLMDAEEWRAIEARVGALPERQVLVLRRTYGDGAPLAVVAAELGVSESRACQIRGEAIRNLRTNMVYCEVCCKSRLDGPQKCPTCGNRLRHLRPDEVPPTVPADPPPPPAGEEVEEDAPAVDGEPSSPPQELTPGLGEPRRPGERYLLTLNGKTQGVTAWARELGLRPVSIYRRLALGLPVEKVLEPPHPGTHAPDERVELTFRGETHTVLEWSARTGIHPSTILWRHARKWSPERILRQKVRPHVSPGAVGAAREGVAVTAPVVREDRRGRQGMLVEVDEEVLATSANPRPEEEAKVTKMLEEIKAELVKRQRAVDAAYEALDQACAALDQIRGQIGELVGLTEGLEVPSMAQKRGPKGKPVTYQGRTLTIWQWSQLTGIEPSTIYTRLKRGWTPERALTLREEHRAAPRAEDPPAPAPMPADPPTAPPPPAPEPESEPTLPEEAAPEEAEAEAPSPEAAPPEEPAPAETAASVDELRQLVDRLQQGVRARTVNLRTTTWRSPAGRAHQHQACVDRFGDGHTTPDNTGHSHRVSRFGVSRVHGHEHGLVGTSS